MPIVTTRCGALPEVMTADYPGLVSVRAPEQIADAVLGMLHEQPFEWLRRRFETQFTVERHLANLAAALRAMEGEASEPGVQPVAIPAA
jgi:glycosyltransferase involved in cell wall biosynthesis